MSISRTMTGLCNFHAAFLLILILNIPCGAALASAVTADGPLKVVLEGRTYTVTLDGRVVFDATGREIDKPGITDRARFVSGLMRKFILRDGLTGSYGFSEDRASLIEVAALLKSEKPGLSALLLQDESLIDPVLRRGRGVPREIFDEFIISFGRESALSATRFMLEYPASSLVMAANEAFRACAVSFRRNLEIFDSVRSGEPLSYGKALEFLRNEMSKETLLLLTGFLGTLQSDSGLLAPLSARGLEERVLALDFSGIPPFRHDGGAVSVFERELWAWDRWADAPLHREIDGFDWWALRTDPPLVRARECRFGTVMRWSPRAREIWDAYRWTWDRSEFMMWKLSWWRLLALRARLFELHGGTVSDDLKVLETDKGLDFQTGLEFTTRFEPILRETLRRFSTVRSYRDLLGEMDRLRKRHAGSIVGLSGKVPVKRDPAWNPRTLLHWGEDFSGDTALGLETGIADILEALGEENSSRLKALARRFGENGLKAQRFLDGMGLGFVWGGAGSPSDLRRDFTLLAEPSNPRDPDSGARVLQEWNYAPVVSLADALRRNLLEVAVEPGGSILGEETVTLRIFMKSREAIQLFIPQGTLVSSSSRFGSSLVIRAGLKAVEEGFEDGHLVVLEPASARGELIRGTIRRVALPAFSLDHRIDPPSGFSAMFVDGATVEAGIGRIVDYHGANRFHPETVLSALVRGDSRFADLSLWAWDLDAARPCRDFAFGSVTHGAGRYLRASELMSDPRLFLLCCQLAIWSASSGLKASTITSAALDVPDMAGVRKCLDHARAESEIITSLAQTILDHSGSPVNLFSSRSDTASTDGPQRTAGPEADCFRRGTALFESGMPARAAAEFGLLLKFPGLNFFEELDAKLYLVRGYLDSGQPERAQDILGKIDFDEAAARHPGSISGLVGSLARLGKGSSSKVVKNRSDRVSFLEEFCATAGDRFPEAYYHLGIELARGGRLGDSARSFAGYLSLSGLDRHSARSGRAREWLMAVGSLLADGVSPGEQRFGNR